MLGDKLFFYSSMFIDADFILTNGSVTISLMKLSFFIQSQSQR
jgi:hypothetical protein